MKKNAAHVNPLSPEVADKLLDLLATDDNFRDLFKNSPKIALLRLGHPSSDIDLTAPHLKVEALADKATIAKARDEIHRSLISSAAMQPIRLNVSLGSTPQLKKKADFSFGILGNQQWQKAS
ncbi:NHLP-related RiPP peptide [Xanthomonas sp. 3058]|uniref:NHLP-related RiPP peptide n=1 Tax=Xanthomonas sp. 3058 TaxID=3035314 RepID=UPI001609A9C2|nr:NHLP-related RiPP peptide [Xanthomonas sp. 3058]MBB5865462.1 putative modified peptide [Xanthomonas sp. 3058]